MMSVVSPAERCSSPVASRSAKCTVKGARGSSAIISRIRRASPGLSSMRRTLCTSVPVGRERDHGEPEDVDRLDHHDEFLEIDGLGHVAVGVQVIGAQHVLFRLGGGEDHDRDALQCLVGLDFLQHFAAVLLRQVEVEQDDVRTRRVGVLAAAVQEVHRIDAVLAPVELVVDLAFLQRLARQALVTGVVFHQQDLYRRTSVCHGKSLFGSVMWNWLPSPSVELTQMRPPWRSTTFLQMARPMPVPGYSPIVCRRWNSMKMRSKYCGSMPMPLSAMVRCHSPSCSSAETWMRGTPWPRNLRALPIRFWNSCASCTSSAFFARSSCARFNSASAALRSVMSEPTPRYPVKRPLPSTIGSPLTEIQRVPPAGLARSISKSRNGSCRSSCALCAAQSASLRFSAGWSQRLRPMKAAASSPVRSPMRRDMNLRPKFSSCSQYQSEESCVRLRKRASLSRTASSAALRSVMSSKIAIS